MLRIIQSTSSAQAKSYYSQADYYLANEQELPGQWQGEGARLLGLSENVKQAEWESLCDNRDPGTGQRITSRQRKDRTIGYDFNFHVPKSLSLLYAETRDERLLDAFRESVQATMEEIESEMQARVRKGGKDENRTTSNAVWGEFIHFTSRPVEGEPDPHLHAHCYLHNLTFDDQENKWKAGQFRELKRDAPYFEAFFHSRLAHTLSDLGLPIERTKSGWELAGIDQGLIKKFSRRTVQIEEKARELGIDDAAIKDGLGAKTREHKQKNLSFAELQDAWRSRMSDAERDSIRALAQRIGGDSRPSDDSAARRAVEFAIEHEFERRSVVPERVLLARALRQGLGEATAEQVRRQLTQADLVLAEYQGRKMATTRQVLEEERDIVEFARRGRGTARPFVRKVEGFQGDRLNEEQQRAVKHILESRDRVMMLRGKAGTGKTTLLKEAKEIIEASGTRVCAFAPSAEASRGELRKDGFKEADTVAMLLSDPRKQRQAEGQLLLIDEAGQLGTRTMHDLFELANRINARVLLCGDRFQHGSVERGAALRLLESKAGIVPAEVTGIQRQKGKYQQAVKAISEGRIEDGFRQLDKMGWIVEIPGRERHQRIASDYVQSLATGKSTLVISPSHKEADQLTREIRQQMRAVGKLGKDERAFRMLEPANLTEAERGDEANLIPGVDVLVFHQNAKGYIRGERVEVRHGQPLPLDQKARFQVFHRRELMLAPGDSIRITRNGFSSDGAKHRLDNGTRWKIARFDESGNIVLDNGWTISKDYGFIDHGHVMTSYSSQGKTVQRVLLAQGDDSLPASSREQFYVSTSRARERVTIYTENRQELLAAVSERDDRQAAMELMYLAGPPAISEPSRAIPLKERETRELIHER